MNLNGKRWRDDFESGLDTKRSKYESGSRSQSPTCLDEETALDFSKTSLSSMSTPTPTPKFEVKEEEKENVGDDVPMDLSKKPATTPDVITVSDSDDDDSRGRGTELSDDAAFVNGEWTKEKQRIVKMFREDLRNEEAKLVLLKKLRHSQRTHQLQESNTNVNKAHSGGQRPPSSAPPPLVRGSGSSTTGSHTTSITAKQQMQQQQQQQQSIGRVPTSAHSQPMRQAHQQPPPLVMNQNMSRHGQSSSQSRSGQSSSPNIMPGYRSGISQSQNQPSQSQQPPQQVDTQTPAQRQAAAKLALRKQLEKTLLQIPPPKPPPPEMNFIPSLASNEFVMLVGLEEVVKTITDLDAAAKGQKTQEVKYVFNPFTCVQCGTDFTPVWKRDKPGSKNVICETCVTSNQKKALKQEHTNRLKSAFVKALQQEQEIEQRMQSQPAAATTTAPSPQPTPSNPMNLASSSYKHSQVQLTHHNLLQAHQAQMRNNPQAAAAAAAALGIPGFNPRMAFPFPYTKPSDIQRQYLLDMIPSRNLPPGAMPWGKN